MRAIILAAGEGTRLKKYTRELPKGMLSFMGKPLLLWQTEALRAAGIEDISIVTGFARDHIDIPGTRKYVNQQYASTNMVFSLMCAREMLDSDVIVSYSDILYEERLVRLICDSPGDINVLVDEDWQKYWKKRYGRVDFDTESLSISDGCIVSLGDENPVFEEIDARFVGLLKFTRRGIQRLMDIWDRDIDAFRDVPWQVSGKTLPNAYMTDMVQALIESGELVRAAPIRGGWIEFDTNEDYENANLWHMDGTLQDLISIREEAQR